MKTKKLLLTALVATCIFSLGINTAYGRRFSGNQSAKLNKQRKLVLDLTQEEQENITWMRLEEKLARDVYITLGKQWNIIQFKRIAKSEQRHMNAIKRLLIICKLTDPIEDNTVGVFSSTHFQDLYDSLIEMGSKSDIDALTVGATIEDLDIKDLEECLNKTDEPIIIRTYEKLMRGSHNHLRAFVKALENKDESYTPQYISQEEFDEIISTPPERGGNGGRGGRGGRNCQNK